MQVAGFGQAAACLCRVIGSGDHRGLPFAIVDKRAATIRLFTAEGAFLGASPALLGQTPGDAIADGVGERT